MVTTEPEFAKWTLGGSNPSLPFEQRSLVGHVPLAAAELVALETEVEALLPEQVRRRRREKGRGCTVASLVGRVMVAGALLATTLASQ